MLRHLRNAVRSQIHKPKLVQSTVVFPEKLSEQPFDYKFSASDVGTLGYSAGNVYIFDKGDLDHDTVMQGLQHAVNKYPMFAGTMKTDKTGLERQKFNGVTFSSYVVDSGNYKSIADLDEHMLKLCNHKFRVGGSDVPNEHDHLLQVKVVDFVDAGITTLGVEMSHSLSDAFTAEKFTKEWSDACNLIVEGKGDQLAADTAPVVVDRQLDWDDSRIPTTLDGLAEAWENHSTGTPVPHSGQGKWKMGYQVLQYYLGFKHRVELRINREEMGKLKAKLVAELGAQAKPGETKEWFSSYEFMVAMLTRCLATQGDASTDTAGFYFIASMRGRSTFMQDNYWGNGTTIVWAKFLDHDRTTGNSTISEAALNVHRALRTRLADKVLYGFAMEYTEGLNRLQAMDKYWPTEMAEGGQVDKKLIMNTWDGQPELTGARFGSAQPAKRFVIPTVPLPYFCCTVEGWPRDNRDIQAMAVLSKKDVKQMERNIEKLGLGGVIHFTVH